MTLMPPVAFPASPRMNNLRDAKVKFHKGAPSQRANDMHASSRHLNAVILRKVIKNAPSLDRCL
jgi:hypothetical protein